MSNENHYRTCEMPWRRMALMFLVLVFVSACKSASEPAADFVTNNNGGDPVVTTQDSFFIDSVPDSRAMAFGFYEFVPQTAQPDETLLSFSIGNKPPWAEFDPTTGTLSGIPVFNDVAMYSDISITASDGITTATLGPFSIDVYVPVLTSATLSWTPPSLRLDDTELDDLAGYVIHYGTSRYRFPHKVNVPSGDLASFFLENIPADRTYFFTITATDSSGGISPPSDIIEARL